MIFQLNYFEMIGNLHAVLRNNTAVRSLYLLSCFPQIRSYKPRVQYPNWDVNIDAIHQS